jgi:glycosyltransferase involved in cell wall biosynthesis
MVEPTNVDGLSTALEQLLTDPEQRARLIDQGRRRAGKYTWRAAAERLLEVYQRVAVA